MNQEALAEFAEQLRQEENGAGWCLPQAPTPCISCGRLIVCSDTHPQCLECHDFELDSNGFSTDEDGEETDLDALAYTQYLRSDHWAAVRQVKISSAGGACACCGSTLSLHVHHREYPKKRLDIKPSMLVVLCKRCHERLHLGEGK